MRKPCLPKTITVKRAERPSKLSEEFIDALEVACKDGLPAVRAAEELGVCNKTLTWWLNIGESIEEGTAKLNDSTDALCHRLYLTVRKAKAAFIRARLNNMLSKAADEKQAWQIDAWLLERLDAEHFGRRLEISGKVVFEANGDSFTAEEVAKIKRLIAPIKALADKVISKPEDRKKFALALQEQFAGVSSNN